MQPDDLTIVFSNAEREPCTELSLVLAAQGIDGLVSWNGSAWILSVPPQAAAAARYEITAYTVEARSDAARRTAPVLSRPGNPWIGVAACLLVIVGIGVLASTMALNVDWFARGRMDGGQMLNGDWWRLFTALTLHADAGHLLGNAAFGSFFGYTAARYLGNGFGWLAIVVSGAFGNLVNGILSGSDHRSIGASTAVFAALGLLSSYCWRRGFPAGASRRERLAPVVAGIGLLAFTGAGGENTDLGAHLFGFASGFGAGLVIARFGLPSGQGAQLLAGVAAGGLIVVSWAAALG
jgi:membrane associated rhomboid family serine protease